MPSSPRTPRRRRKSSNLSHASIPPSPTVNGHSSMYSNHSRKTSISSLPSPTATRRTSFHGHSRDVSQDLGSSVNGGDSLGNLADELAEAWEEGEEVQGQPLAAQLEGAEVNTNGHSVTPQFLYDQETSYKSPSPQLPPQNLRSLSPTKNILKGPKHRRKRSRPHHHHHHHTPSDYSGSEYGSDTDLEPADLIPPSLEAALADIEHLARIGTSSNGSEQDIVIPRFSASLRDLASQAGVENAASRLMTAHTSLTMHLTYQTRALLGLLQPFLSPYSPTSLYLFQQQDQRPNPSSASDPPHQPSQTELPTTDLYTLLTTHLLPSLISTLPHPSLHTTPLLTSLRRDTLDLTTLLSSLSDFLHESRHTALNAQRRLKSAREMVTQLRKEDLEAEAGRSYVEKGDWERRLREREAGRACRGVVEGFEGVCGIWRDRLLRGTGAMEAVGVV